MTERLKYTVANIGPGWVGVLGSDSGLVKLTLPKGSAGEAERRLGGEVGEAVRADEFFAGLIQRLKSYFAGRRVAFDDELDLSRASAFQGEVWQLATYMFLHDNSNYLHILPPLSQ